MKKEPPVSAREVLVAMLSVAQPPDGQLRTITSSRETERLSTELLSALYGSSAGKWYQGGEYSIIDDGAVYLSEVMYPFELAVFRCINEGDVSGGLASVLGVCSGRIELIKAAWQGSAHEAFVQNATVTYCGAYVILVVAEDPEPMIQAAEKIIKSY